VPADPAQSGTTAALFQYMDLDRDTDIDQGELTMIAMFSGEFRIRTTSSWLVPASRADCRGRRYPFLGMDDRLCTRRRCTENLPVS